MIRQEQTQIDSTGLFPWVEGALPDFSKAVNGIAELKLSADERAELLDVKAWGPMLETYGRTMKVAVALTDAEGNLLGKCHNAQPVWTLHSRRNSGERDRDVPSA